MDISHFLVLVFIGFLFVKKNFRMKIFDMIKKNKIFLVAGSLLLIYIVANEPFVVEGMSGDHCHPPIIPCGTEGGMDEYKKWGSENTMDAKEGVELEEVEENNKNPRIRGNVRTPEVKIIDLDDAAEAAAGGNVTSTASVPLPP